MNDKSLPERALSYLALFTIFAAPLVFFSHRFFPFITSKSFFFMGMAEICFFLWMYLAIQIPKYRLKKNQILVFLIPTAFLAALTISGILGTNPNLAFWSSFERATGLIFLYHCLVFSIVIASLINVFGRQYLTKIYQAFFYSGIILALSTFISAHFINIPSLFFKSTDSGDLLGNSSHSAAYLIFTLFTGGMLLFDQGFKKNRLWVGFGLGIIMLSPLADHARGVTLGIVAGAVLAVLVCLTTRNKKHIRVIGASLIGLMLVAIVVVGILLMKPGTKIHQGFVSATTNSRFIFWDAAVKGIKERPIFGWGPENYNVVFSKYFNPTILEEQNSKETAVDKVHNGVLEQFVAGGFVGGSLYLLFLGAIFFLPIYLYRKKSLSLAEMALFEGLFLAYFLQNLIFFDIVNAYIAMFAIFGLLVGCLPRIVEPNEKNLKGYESLVALLCLALFVPAWIYCVYEPTKKAKNIYYLYNASTGENNFASLTRFSPMGEGNTVGFIAVQMMRQYRDNTAAILKDPAFAKRVHNDILTLLGQVDATKDSARNMVQQWIAAAQLVNFDMMLTNDFSEVNISRAKAYVDHAAELSPTDPRVYWIYGQFYIYIKDYKKADEAFKKALALDPNVYNSQDYLSKFESLFGNKIR